MPVSVFGVRHHGPGSARSVAAALDALAPDAVLIEAPPEGEEIAALAIDPTMVPPVALLAYVPGDPARSAFWPFAAFSPEWHAMRHALARGVTLRFIDLPATHMLADDPDADPEPGKTTTQTRTGSRTTARTTSCRSHAATRSACSPMPAATPIRRTGGRTSSSTAPKAATTTRSSPRSPTRWPPSAPRPASSRRTRRAARPRCGPRSDAR